VRQVSSHVPTKERGRGRAMCECVNERVKSRTKRTQFDAGAMQGPETERESRVAPAWFM